MLIPNVTQSHPSPSHSVGLNGIPLEVKLRRISSSVVLVVQFYIAVAKCPLQDFDVPHSIVLIISHSDKS